jgi:peptidoglycan-associated lipoprotein
VRFSRKREMRKTNRETTNPFGGSWAPIGEWSVIFFLLLISFTIASCAPRQVYIPVAERAALEDRRVQDMETDRASSSTAKEAGREGRDGKDGITVQDISSGPGGGRGEDNLKTHALIQDIYFDFDSYTLKSEDLPRLKDLSVWLKAHKGINLTVEGHCDERGSIEYNMALGQKRSEAVSEYLLALGVEKGHVKTISYGKETPVITEHTEEAWAKNRRAHMKIE